MTFLHIFLEYESAGVEESKTGFGFAIAQKRREIQPPTSKNGRGSRGRIFEDRGLIFCNVYHFHTLPTILYKCVIMIGGRLHAANHKLKLRTLRSKISADGRPTAVFLTFTGSP